MRHLKDLTVTLAALTLLAACTNDDDPQTKASPSMAEGRASTAPASDYTVLGGANLYGPGRWGITAFGDPDAPVAVLDVPAGFQGHESWVWTDEQGPGEFAQLTSWAPTRVPTDPCAATAPSPPVGPTVQDLAAALAAQKRTTTTTPTPVTLDGQEGLYLELSTPRRFDYQACGPDGMQIWETDGSDGRALSEPVTDRYWIIDVDGQRVVIAALTLPTATSETVGLITGLAEAISFEAQE